MKDTAFTSYDCINRPLKVIRHQLEKSYANSTQNEVDIPAYFKTIFSTEESVLEIPSLNDISVYDIPHHSLVRFRAMIQNTGFGHEMFVSFYETSDHKGNKKWKFNKYSDDMDTDVMFDFDPNTHYNQFDERYLYYCVSVPGETQWAKQVYRQECPSFNETETDVEEIVRSTANMHLDSSKNEDRFKKVASKFPFPNEDHVAAIIKFYEKDDSLKVTDVVEFIGVLSHPKELSDDEELEQDDAECSFDVAFSIVPCIHAIYYRPLHMSSNPLMSFRLIDPYEIQRRASHIRNSLLQYIATAFRADYLVAEFVLLQLLSRIYNRRNDLTLGKLVLNINNVPSCPIVTNENISSSSNLGLIHSNMFTKRVSTVLSSLLPKYHDLPLTLSAFNEFLFYPRDNDKLDSGILQVSQGTWFLIDETVMEEGKLDEIGVRNLQALNEILDSQKLKYAFPFNDFEFETDIGAIILSNARSFLPCDCIIPLLPNAEETLMFDVQEETLSEFRIYLSTLRCAEYSIPENVSEHIQNEFVNQRKNASKTGQPLVTQADLLLRMTLARLVTLSFGQLELTPELWDYTQNLDEQRKQRIQCC
ncbi:putative alanine racemase-domain-containing protein [Gigaspora margarita]|uniref:Putative alanine racemase-domain-containing protein n=1 Tax=Gigaspora margarita TaxID=4874 RepID=A0A8H3X9E8_GIGMA|nr:putative alanine racemase-domain-containing protein [Gigaspora margarita]